MASPNDTRLTAWLGPRPPRPHHGMTTEQRFRASYLIPQGPGCWIWVRTRHTRMGYGAFYVNGKTVSAHRYAWESENGPIPDGLTIDHLCRTPACVNPRHLEPVTMRENILRGRGVAAVNAVKTHCPQGHEYSRANTYRHPRGNRVCRICRRAYFEKRQR